MKDPFDYDKLRCTKHNCKLSCMGGRSAHWTNWYCAQCDLEVDPVDSLESVKNKIELALAAERERLCAAIKLTDEQCSERNYLLTSDDCIEVIRGTWK